ncbi:MAG: anthranilate synthase component 1 [Saprospiraceae bacterium]|jgi:anthranilate synthase component 1
MTATDSKIAIRTIIRRRLADTVTPVSLYLKIREHYSNTVLLESNDFRSAENSFSFIGIDPIATFKVQNGRLSESFPNEEASEEELSNYTDVPTRFQAYLQRFDVEQKSEYNVINGFLGHTSFDGVQYFDTLKFDPEKRKFDLPDINYSLYRFVIAINHFKEEMYFLENIPTGEKSQLDKLERRLDITHITTQNRFILEGKETSNLTDDEFKKLVTKGKHYCQIGEVFQIVFSRQFQQKFKGDDFNVYRVLRSINPSPYLFYFDYGDYKIFGSSPEAQMVIKDNEASVNPIAGTYKRSGDDEEDRRRAAALAADPKENAEHIMLVDLARNDLGRCSTEVTVNKLKEVQYFSHVIHLVSNVKGKLNKDSNPVQVFGDTFPAGTLSGAPKYRALELINKHENQNRAFYGGGIGYIGFNGDMNQAIVIRSFMSMNNTLHYQAGAGIVVSSNEESELQEVNNKLGALTKALNEAEKL